MTEKRYKLEQWTSSSLYYSFPDGNLHHSIGEVIARVENDLNSLYNDNEQLKKEKGRWKSIACTNSSFNSILLHELDIAKEQGYTVSEPFKKLMEDWND